MRWSNDGVNRVRSKWTAMRNAGFTTEYIATRFGVTESQVKREIKIFLTDQQIGLAKLNACPFGDVCKEAGLSRAQTRALFRAINRMQARRGM